MPTLFPDSARTERGALALGGVPATSSPSASGRRSSSTARRRFSSQDARCGRRRRGRASFYGTRRSPTSPSSESPRGGDRGRRRRRGRARLRARGRVPGRDLVVHGKNKDEAFLREAAWTRSGRARRATTRSSPAIAGVEQVLVRVTLGVDADRTRPWSHGHHGSKSALPPAQARELLADALGRGSSNVLAVARARRAAAPTIRAQAETIRGRRVAATCHDSLGFGGPRREPRERLRIAITLTTPFPTRSAGEPQRRRRTPASPRRSATPTDLASAAVRSSAARASRSIASVRSAAGRSGPVRATRMSDNPSHSSTSAVYTR